MSARAARRESKENRMNKRAIIAIEDDPGDQTLLRMAFDQCKFAHELRVFNTGEEALRHLVAAAAANSVETAPVALVLVDFNMPGLKGDEVIALMRANQRLRAIPAVMLSGSARESDINLAYDKGANAYLRKSLDFEEFTDVIRETVTFWADYNLVPSARVS
jgi:CheY-like chemotaxis protein